MLSSLPSIAFSFKGYDLFVPFMLRPDKTPLWEGYVPPATFLTSVLNKNQSFSPCPIEGHKGEQAGKFEEKSSLI